ncbi:hypothetical protein SteCoe_13882 [Stentor coeruleus]|uniref:DUF4378 domain-containing protein n=1 Tax=Stentor coeruleus TaxID=5963 RepID=A0A1R2C7C9_9CILI|nr:hypothetical protein SteCoe_13882 [Stentor coeruleus]
MESNFDPWSTGNLHISRSFMKENIQNSSSSTIIGRKLNLYQKVLPQNSSSNMPTVIEPPSAMRRLSRSRSRQKSLSKSPLRSISQRRNNKNKEYNGDIPHYVSPPRQTRNSKNLKKSSGKLMKSATSRKSILIESQNKNHPDFVETQKKTLDEKSKKVTLKEKLKITNKKIREKNAKTSRRVLQKHPLPWGFDQRILKDTSHSKSAENDETRLKIKTEREASKKAGHKTIGLDFYPLAKTKTKLQTKDEKSKTKKSPDPGTQKYMKNKNKSRKINDLQKQVEENTKEKERINTLEKFDKNLRKKRLKHRRKRKSRSKSKGKYFDDKSTEITHSLTRTLRNKSKNEKKKKKKSKANTEIVTERLKNLEERVYSNYDFMKVDAAIKIQRWYRLIKDKKHPTTINQKNDLKIENSEITSDKYLMTECEEWISFLNPSTKHKELNNDLADRFRGRLDEKQKEIEKKILESKNISDPILHTVSPNSNDFSELSDRNATNSDNITDRSSLKISALSLSGLNFQTKRPKQLDIESINTPLITCTYDSENESNIKKNTSQDEISIKSNKSSPKFKKSYELIKESQESEILESKDLYKSLSENTSEIRSLEDENTSLMIRNLQERVKITSDSEEQTEEKFQENNENEEIYSENSENNENKENKENKEFKDEKEKMDDENYRSDNEKEEIEEKKDGEKFVEENYDDHSPLQEISLHSFHVEKAQDNELSDKDSLENDISQISSALMKNKDKSAEEEINDSIIEFQGNRKLNDPDNLISKEDKCEFPFENSAFKLLIFFLKRICRDLLLKSNPNNQSSDEYSISDVINEICDKEINEFLEIIPFKIKEKDVDPTNDYIETYLGALLEELQKNEPEMLEAINTPAYQDPLTKLMILQNTEVGELSKFPKLELILPFDISAKLKSKLECSNFPYRSIYLQMMFDCINEALNHIRPFGLKGVPDPWATKPQLLFGDGDLCSVFRKLLSLLMKWSIIQGGAYPDNNIKEDEDKLQNLREERMSAFLCFDVNDEESGWIGYDDEETQSKLDVADFVLEDLVEEIIKTIT